MAMKERRNQNRMLADYDVYLNHQGSSYMACSHDITNKGVGILTDKELKQGELANLKIVLPVGTLNLNISGTVIYCIENPVGPDSQYSYLVGVEYEEESDEDFGVSKTKDDLISHSVTHSLSINAPAKKCYGLICDFARYPEWAGIVEKASVLEKYPDGRDHLVEFEANIIIRKITYALDYSYDDDNHCLSWTSAGGDLLTVNGKYYFTPRGENMASSTYELLVASNFYFPKRMIQYFANITMRKAMKDFKKFVEKN